MTKKNNVKVLLVDPVPLSFSSPSIIKGNTLEPYACEVLAAALDDLVENAIETDTLGNIIEKNVKVLQSKGNNEFELAQAIIDEKPDIIGFSVRTCYYTRATHIASSIRKIIPDALIIFGGYHPSIDPENTLNNCNAIDIAIVGEGEETLCEIVNTYIEHKRNLENYKNIQGAYVRDFSAYFQRRKRLSAENWEVYAQKVINHRKPKEAIAKCRNWNLSFPAPSLQNGVAQIQTQRGCPGDCSFCCTPNVWGDVKNTKSTDKQEYLNFRCGYVTQRKVENVVAEIKSIRDSFLKANQKPLNFFYFNDVTFNYYTKNGYYHLKALCNEMINSFGVLNETNQKIINDFKWFCLCRIPKSSKEAKDFIEILPLMAQAGCSKIGFGIESASNKIQIQYNKMLEENIIKAVLKASWETGIINRAYLILGAPEETEETFNQTEEFLLNEDVFIDQIRVAFAVPFPGTKSAEEWIENIITPHPSLDDYTEDIPIVKCPLGNKEDLINKRVSLIRNFYMNEKYEERVREKVRRFPYLKQSYEEFFVELCQISNFTIDHRKFNFNI
ncbi:MAG: cobalamin-dependent protein [Paludibacter sp.]